MIEYILQYNGEVPTAAESIRREIQFQNDKSDYIIFRYSTGFILQSRRTEALERKMKEGFNEVAQKYGITILNNLHLVRVISGAFAIGYIPHRHETESCERALQQLK